MLNEKKTYQTFRNEKDLFLGAVLCPKDKGVSVLYTINTKQKFTFCSKCSKQKCPCFAILERGIDEKMVQMLDLDPDHDTTKYWEKYRKDRPLKMEHYNDEPIDFNTKYGYNRTSFCYPFERDQELSDKLERKKMEILPIPLSWNPYMIPQSSASTEILTMEF